MTTPGFTCPQCGATSHHPVDIAEGYCGACHDWTGRGAAMICACGQPIEPCDCGGQACPGWGHPAPAARHWCGRAPADGQPRPADGARRTARQPDALGWTEAPPVVEG